MSPSNLREEAQSMGSLNTLGYELESKQCWNQSDIGIEVMLETRRYCSAVKISARPACIPSMHVPCSGERGLLMCAGEYFWPELAVEFCLSDLAKQGTCQHCLQRGEWCCSGVMRSHAVLSGAKFHTTAKYIHSRSSKVLGTAGDLFSYLFTKFWNNWGVALVLFFF